MFRWGTLGMSRVVFRCGEKVGQKRSGGKNFIVHSEELVTERQAGAAEAGKPAGILSIPG